MRWTTYLLASSLQAAIARSPTSTIHLHTTPTECRLSLREEQSMDIQVARALAALPRKGERARASFLPAPLSSSVRTLRSRTHETKPTMHSYPLTSAQPLQQFAAPSSNTVSISKLASSPILCVVSSLPVPMSHLPLFTSRSEYICKHGAV